MTIMRNVPRGIPWVVLLLTFWLTAGMPVGASMDIPLLPGEPAVGQLFGQQTEYWYEVEIDEPGGLLVSAESFPGLTFTVRLYDGDTLLASDTGGSSERRTVQRDDLYPGVYRVRVQRSAGEGSFQVEAKHIPSAYSNDLEPNDTRQQAQPLAAHGVAEGLLGFYLGGPVDLEDWYVLQLDSPGHLSIQVLGEGTLAFTARLYAADGTTILDGDTSGNSSTRMVERPDLQPGRYYLRLYRSGGYGGYRIQPRFNAQSLPSDLEANTSVEQAVERILNERSTGTLGYFDGRNTDTEDWYFFDVRHSGELSLRIEGQATLHFTARLYDSDGTTVLHSDTGGSSFTRLVQRRDLRPGRYYLRLSRTQGYGGYEMFPFFSRVPDEWDSVPAALEEHALPLGLYDTRTAILGFYQQGHVGTESWYEVQQPQTGSLLVSVVAPETLTFNLRLYNEWGTNIRSDTGGAQSERLVAMNMQAAAPYSVRISRSGGYGAYSVLAITDTDGLWPNPIQQVFPPVAAGRERRETQVAIVNASRDPVQVSHAQITGADASAFQLTSRTPAQIDGRSQAVLGISFASEQAGIKQATLEVVTSLGVVEIGLLGQGYREFPTEIIVDPRTQGEEMDGSSFQLRQPESDEPVSPAEALGILSSPAAVQFHWSSHPSSGALAWTETYQRAESGPIEVHFRNLPGNDTDWIAIAPADWDVQRSRQWQFTGGQESGTLEFDPQAPGRYEVRVFFDWPGGGYTLHSAFPFQIVE